MTMASLLFLSPPALPKEQMLTPTCLQDPQQRLLLETTYEALESAGIRQEQIQKSNTAVYMAMFTRDYDRNIYKDMMSIPKYHVTGTGDAILANRISHLFDLNGPSVTVDTGCSGGMTAISHACQALRSGESDIALAGAANLILSPDHMISMSNLHMLNADGRSYSFDSRGAGYGRGEGVATLVIKRLDDAISANDPIRAIILDAAINQDGHTAGITLPSGVAQTALERKVWKNIGLHPRDVGYVEAHGTGTLAGDSAELAGISQVFCQGRDTTTPLFVGSIKSNIGHLESASGLAAVIKAVMILEHDAIPPNVNFEYPRANLNLDQKKIKVPTALEPWSQPGIPRISVNSFGYGGTNAHAVLERSPRPTMGALEDATATPEIPRLFMLSAASQSSLLNILGTTGEWVSKHPDQISLRDLSYTLCQRRSIMPWRYSCVAANQQELLGALDKASKKMDAITRISPDVKVTFVFTGQGAQWPGMGRELFSDPTFKDSIQRSRQMLQDLGSSWDLIEELLREDKESRLKEAELAQPATTAIQIALVDLVRTWGIVPDTVVGHSSGEIGAAYAAGYLSHYMALKVSYFRGFSASISKEKGLGKGGMLAVGVGEEDVAKYLTLLRQGVAVVACQNSPSNTTISGDDAAISELSEILTQEGIFNRKLNVDTAYHSHHMQAAAGEYKSSLGRIVEDISPRSTTVKLFSSVTGSQKSSRFDADYWTSNLVSKVRFCDALQSLCRAEQTSSRSIQPHRIFIEIGPHAALAGPARQCIADLAEPVPYNYNSVLVRGTGAVHSALAMVGNVFDHGYPADLVAVSALDPTSNNALVLRNLPSYSWDHSKRHWHESRLSRDYRLRKYPYHDLLGLRMTDNTPLRPAWRHMVGVEGLPWLRDHVVDGLMIFPGAGYLCMALEAASQLVSTRHPERKARRFLLKDVSFLKGLVIPEGRARVEVQLIFNPIEAAESGRTMQHGFSVTAFTGDEQWNEHCRGLVVVEFASEQEQSLFGAPVTYGEMSDILDPVSTKTIQSDELYKELERVGNIYGPTFSGIEKLSMDADRAVSRVVIPDVVTAMPANYMRPHIIHPATLDILLHSSLPLVNQKLGPGSVMPVRIDEIALSADIENAPGKTLSAIAILTSSHFRAAEADLFVFPGKGDPTATPIISVSGMELRSLASEPFETAALQDARDICYEIKWGPDERFISAKHLQPSRPMVSPQEQLKIMDEATEIYIHRCLARVRDENLAIPEDHHKLLYEWMKKSIAPTKANRLSGHDDELLKIVNKHGAQGELLTRLGPVLPYILTGKTNAHQLMLEDDLLYRVADESSARCYSLMSQYLKHKRFKQSDLSVLEIGGGTGDAALQVLEALKAYGARPAVYDFATDTSRDGFDRARNKLEDWSDVVNFRPLDMGKDPVDQGFEQNSYDIVLACTTLYATSSIDSNLFNARRLLKPDGVLLLIEVTNPQRYLNITFGTLPGWWKGVGEGRDTRPFLTTDQWSNAMSQASLRMQFAAQDDDSAPMCSLMVARAVDNADIAALPEIRLIVEPGLPDNLANLATEISAALRSRALQISTSSWGSKHPHDNTINVVIDDGSKPILADISPDRFQDVRDLLKKRPSRVIWVSAQDNEINRVNPQKHLITGMARTAHAENEDLQMVTIDMQQSLDRTTQPRLLDILMEILQSFSKTDLLREREYVYNGTDVLVPRVIPSSTLNRQVSSKNETITETKAFTDPRVPLKLDTQRKESLSHPVFVEDEAHRVALGKDSVEIRAKALGIPFKLLQSNTSVNEYAGVVTATGSGVSAFQVGDRVVAFGAASYANRLRVPETQVQLLPDRISFIAAAALPVSFMTACHALVGIADVQPGQIVLIDDAASDVGQAALAVAKHLGAQVIAAVSRVDEATFLTNSFKISSSHVIPRESYVCRRQIHNIVGPEGLDVVLGCSRSHVSNEIIEAVKPFGTMIHVRSRGNDSKRRGNVASKQHPNATISTFDLESLIQAKPKNASRLLQQVMVMISEGMSLESQRVTAVAMKDFEEAFKLARQEGVDKYVLDVGEDSVVKAARPSHTILKLDSDATYVVAGGLGDLGKRLLRLMAQAGARYLVTLSRSGSSSAEHQKLEKELQHFGAGCVLYSVKCDVADEASTRAALSEIKAKGLPMIKGVIQATVALRDSTLDTMTAEVFNSVLQSKSRGTLNLQRVFAPEDLTFFISLSSAVNIIGTAGQANYNAGNSVQDALAQFNETSNCFYISLNIGTIEDATVNNQAIVQSLRRQGLSPVRPEELLAFFEYAMSADAREAGCHQAVIGFTPESLAGTTATNGTAHTLMFTHVRQTARAEMKNDTAMQTKTFKDVIVETSDQDEISLFVAKVIGKKLADLVAIDAADVSLSSSIMDFGLDSLIAIELRNWIMREFDAPIQSSEVLDSPDIWSLAQKVTLRSRLANGDTTETNSSSEGIPISTLPTSRSHSQESQKRVAQQLPLPVPDLGDTLRMFVDSQKAICSPEELEELAHAVEDFQESGLELQQALQANASGPESRLEFYENNMHLERREPLQDHALFYLGHLTDGAPSHSQADRAAIITIAALTFKKRFENGVLEQNSLNDVPLCMETLKWMFHVCQEPRKELDHVRKYPSSNNIVVMRRGHLYQVAVREEDGFTPLTALFADLIASSEQALPAVSVLTSKVRDDWAELRSELKGVASNDATLEAVESAAFVVCLDDTAPVTPSERCTAILLNDRHLTNRWLDKTVQFTVAANGVSALLAENGKLDGLSVRQLQEYITDEIFAHPSSTPLTEQHIPASTVRELAFDIPPLIAKSIEEQTSHNLASYKPIGAFRHHFSELSRSFLGSKGLRSKGTVLISILLATRLFYGFFEPAWETVTVAKYAKGRIDWLQSLTPDIALWIEAAIKFMESGKGDAADLVRKLRDAAIGHAQTLRQVADGRGYVEPLYSLMGVALAEEEELPELFSSAAWRHCDRHATPKRAKTDCLGSGGYLRMQEGGFFMPNPNSVFVHYEVHHPDPLIVVQGLEEDVAKFEGCLNQAIKTVRAVIEGGS
jgi:acyl transferase domain-containing protein/NADPH:quinone reductase-like Zn-dependent oxidoreductase/acyl carrier protein